MDYLFQKVIDWGLSHGFNLAQICLFAVLFFFYLRLNRFEKTLNKIKLNIKAIVAFLATYTPKFDSGIIEAMSPIQIKDRGYIILEESGFKSIMENNDTKNRVLSCIAQQNPTAKLDVEKYAIVFFSTLLEEDFMKPIKTYLYEHPNEREIYPTLAGVYIRDKYLSEHPEIT